MGVASSQASEERDMNIRILLLSLALLTPALNAHEDESPKPAHTHSSAGVQRLPDGSVYLPKPSQRRIDVRTSIATQGEHALPLELNGRVIMDPNAGGRVQAPFEGRIDLGPKGIATVGRQVKRGEILAVLHPTASAIDRGNQQAQLAELRAQRVIAEQRARRLSQLEGSVARKDIDASQAEARSLREREAAVSASLSRAESLRAPVAGIVGSANAVAGQIVDGRDLLFEIVDPNRLLVEALSADASVAARVERAALRDQAGTRLTYVGGGMSLREGALPLVFRLTPEQTGVMPRLALGQPVTVIAQLKDRVSGIALPSEAVVRNAANEAVVWTKAGPQRFVAQVVTVAPLDASTVVVTQGLAPNTRIVVTGASLLNQIR
jgi:membrane fusion protein, heavy metal efflux system